EKYWMPLKKKFSGTRPMACPISCRKADTRSGPGVKPVPMPTKPSVNWVKSPKHAPTLELIQKFVKPLRLLPAGRLAALKKPGWPKVSRSVLSCEYVNVNTASELTSASEMNWLGITWPRYDPKPTSNTTEMLSVNVASRMLMAVCSSWRKLLIWAWVNGPSVKKSLLTVICMMYFPLSHREGRRACGLNAVIAPVSLLERRGPQICDGHHKPQYVAGGDRA